MVGLLAGKGIPECRSMTASGLQNGIGRLHWNHNAEYFELLCGEEGNVIIYHLRPIAEFSNAWSSKSLDGHKHRKLDMPQALNRFTTVGQLDEKGKERQKGRHLNHGAREGNLSKHTKPILIYDDCLEMKCPDFVWQVLLCLVGLQMPQVIHQCFSVRLPDLHREDREAWCRVTSMPSPKLSQHIGAWHWTSALALQGQPHSERSWYLKLNLMADKSLRMLKNAQEC